MDGAALEALASEMRLAIIDAVSLTGGHLGSSLGAVEITVALHAELDSPRDKILWDPTLRHPDQQLNQSFNGREEKSFTKLVSTSGMQLSRAIILCPSFST